MNENIFVEALRGARETTERLEGAALDEMRGDRAAVRALVAKLDRCWKCMGPATKGSSERPARFCDEHVIEPYTPTGAGYVVAWGDLPYAPELRALIERMKTWQPAMEVANDAR